MTPGGASPPGDPTAGNPRTGWTRRELDVFARRLSGRPHPAGDDRAASPPDHAPAAPRHGRLAVRTVALIILGCALLAFLIGALASTERSGTSAPRVAGRPGEAGGATTESAASEAGPIVGTDAPPSSAAPTRPESGQPSPPSVGDTGEATVRAFYAALGRADGAEASALVVPEKRSSRAYSPQAIARFYGNLREPLRLTAVTPLAPESYRVGYAYLAGRSPCDGAAVVNLTPRDGRLLIRSIRALNGC